VICSVVDVGTAATRDDVRRAVSFPVTAAALLGGLLVLIWVGGGALAWAIAQVRPDWDSNRALRQRLGRRAAGAARPGPVTPRPSPEGTDPTV
jgi:hypothetical protein